MTSRSEDGCSRISLYMKCLWPPLSIVPASQETMCEPRLTARLAGSKVWQPSRVSTAESPSASRTTVCVCATTAAASEVTKCSSFGPMPRRSGLPLRAATIFPGSRALTTAIPYVPSILARAPATASSRESHSRKARSMRWTSTSVSVSLRKTYPRSRSRGRWRAALSMMPLWTRAMSRAGETCGCAFAWFGTPCVAQRVCAIPHEPSGKRPFSASSSFAIFPGRFSTASPPPASTTASPAESYPRYSSRLRPSSRIGPARRGPTYPMIPHISEPAHGPARAPATHVHPGPPRCHPAPCAPGPPALPRTPGPALRR